MSADRDPDDRSGVGLSLIMPALNEEESVERALRISLSALEAVTRDYEIIFINDGSTDRTAEIAERLAAETPHLRVIHNERNLNYGVSLLRGIQAARCEWILHEGVDLPLAPKDIAKFLPHLEDFDVVVVRRVDRSAHSPWRKVTSWVNNMLLRVLFQPRTRDLNFTQFYRRSFAQNVRLLSTSPAFVTPELILRAEKTGKRVRELEAEFCKRSAGKAHFGRLNDIAWTLRDMFRVRVTTLLHGWMG